MQSTTFRLLSASITLLLLSILGLLVALVLRQDPVPIADNAVQRTSIPLRTTITATQQLITTPTVAVVSTTTEAQTIAKETIAIDATAVHRAQTGVTPISTLSQRTPNAVSTATLEPAILQPTVTPIPITAMRAPINLTAALTPGWFPYSNGNQVYDLTVVDTTIWAATGGGVVAWNRTNNTGEKFTTLDGLSANRTTSTVYCPIGDLGLLFGSNVGLQILDARSNQWRTLTSDNSDLQDNHITTLHCDLDNQVLLVGYRDRGLGLYDAALDEWRLLNQRSGLGEEQINAVATVADLTEIWVATDRGIFLLTAEGTFAYDSSNSPLDTDRVGVIIDDGQGTIWVGAQGRVYAIADENWTIYSPTYVLASQFPTGNVTDLYLDSTGALWIASDAGELCKFDTAAVTCDPFFTAEELGIASAITALTGDGFDRIYVATAANGIRFYDGANWRPFVLPQQFPGNQIQAITQDANGYLWVKSETGLIQFDPTQFDPTQSVATSVNGDAVNDVDSNDSRLNNPTRQTTGTASFWRIFTPDNSTYPVDTIALAVPDAETGLWVGGASAGYFNGEAWQTYTITDGLAAGQIQALTLDSQGRTWFGTRGGLSIWNGDSFFNLTEADGLPSDQITALLKDNETIWVGTNSGLLRFADSRLQLYNQANSQLPSDQIQALALARDGSLLIGTAQGLARFIGTTVSVVPELADESIIAIAAMPDGVLWLGTAQSGLIYFNGVRWRTSPDTVLPPAPTVTTLFVDQQETLWIGADGGLLRYIP